MEFVVFCVLRLILSFLVGNYGESHGENKAFLIFVSFFTSPVIGLIIARVNKKY